MALAERTVLHSSIRQGHTGRDEPGVPRTIVVAVDASDRAAKVLDIALRLTDASPTNALHVVHVLRSSRFDHARAGAPRTPASAIAEAKEERLDPRVRAAHEKSRAEVVGHFAVGEPATEILRFCADLKADLLVVGTHDRKGLERLLLGSITETLVRRAKCPVCVIHPDDGS